MEFTYQIWIDSHEYKIKNKTVMLLFNTRKRRKQCVRNETKDSDFTLLDPPPLLNIKKFGDITVCTSSKRYWSNWVTT